MTLARNIALLIDDDPNHAASCKEALAVSGDDAPNFEWVRTLACGLERLAEQEVWAVFLSLSLPDGRGPAALLKVVSVAPDMPVVVLGSLDDEDTCQTALSQGAHDYLLEGHLDG